MSRQMLATRVASGDLVQVRRGVYLAASAWPSDANGQQVTRARAEQVVHPGAVISHASAAIIWGLPHPGFLPWHDCEPVVTLPAGSGAKSRGGQVIHHIALLPRGQVTKDEDGYEVTTVARTAVDLAARLPLPDALVLLDGAARIIIGQLVVRPRRDTYGNPRLGEAATRLLLEAASCRRSGTLAAHIALADARRESAAESASAGYFHLAGLPTPEYQCAITTRTGTYFPDFYWRAQRVIGESDGAVKYTDPGTLVAEKVREDSLREIGNEFVRWIGGEIFTRPETVVGRVSRKLDL